MTRLPRDLSARDLVLALGRLGYEVTRQTGSHLRLTTARGGEHHLTIPNHKPLKVGTLSAILNDVAGYLETDKQDLVSELFGQ